MLECKKQIQLSKISDHKNVNKRKNRLTPAKLESKKQDKKNNRPGEGSGWEAAIVRQEEATSHLVSLTSPHTHPHYRKQRKGKTAL